MGALMTPDGILWFALRHARPHQGTGIAELMGMLRTLAAQAQARTIYTDGADNLWIDTRTGAEGQKTMFQAHLDTVATEDGEHEIWMGENNLIHTGGKAVLGADDGAGVGILAALIHAKVPALYLFSQNEERGGTGAAHAVQHEAGRVADISRCIAFDRKGRGEICGAQCVGTLASRAFVSALSVGLGLDHAWGVGTYTDDAEWRDLIPEIVNVSVGYGANHSVSETLDWDYYQRLRDAAVALDWDTLPTEGADPNADRDSYWGAWYDSRSGWGRYDTPRHTVQRTPRVKVQAPAYSEIEDLERETLWDLCDELGIDPGGYGADMIRRTLGKFSRDLRRTWVDAFFSRGVSQK